MSKNYLEPLDLPRDRAGFTGQFRKQLCEVVNKTRGKQSYRDTVRDILEGALGWMDEQEERMEGAKKTNQEKVADQDKAAKVAEKPQAQPSKKVEGTASGAVVSQGLSGKPVGTQPAQTPAKPAQAAPKPAAK